MNDAAWTAYLGTLPPQHRELAQHIMTRVQAVLNSDRSSTLDDINALLEKLVAIQREIDALNVRIDEWDGSRSRVVGA